ncbi:hypothetical protein [Flavobacterium sp. HBTb2-11-1]|uniref:hypothetical protein n=1 Tax=Flavobacterium sp. HBTb2-11-1 TaxID=2692212 RepID=UPI001371613B|nr:hypothetical protein [Flavobacterium sp. HBTb2-11-1]MXO06072.1 hypothetical protein [Flavobacterium sp. HBTb2-11-1]
MALFIENNPVSNLKTNSGSTDYYFDHKNITAIKNDKNEAAYSIPLYITSEKRSNILNNLSVEITDTNVDIKLVTIEGMDNGTIRYSASPFHGHQANYTPSKTARIDCYCVTVYSDCSCHSTHATGGCDYPNVFTSCGCSGDGYSDPEPSPTTPATKSSWTGGSGGGTSYGNTGEGIYIALQKMFKPDYQFSALEKYTIINNYQYSKALIDFLNNEGFTPANKAFTLQMLYNIEDGQFTIVKQLNNSIQNFIYSQKSPVNVDLTAIYDNINLPENQKFKEIYDGLSKSNEFQKLFIDLFGNNSRFNVKFELVDAVYDSKDPTKEINANTIYDPNLPYTLIQINKKKLNDSSIKQTRIENARTIIHEFIHAYLFTISNNPIVGEKDIVSLLNKKYPTAEEQHDFMYNNMIPTITKILTESRDFLTFPIGRSEVESLTVYTTKDQSSSEIWNWKNYFESISLQGLDETISYKKDFPKDSDALFKMQLYIQHGRTWLDKKN